MKGFLRFVIVLTPLILMETFVEKQYPSYEWILGAVVLGMAYFLGGLEGREIFLKTLERSGVKIEFCGDLIRIFIKDPANILTEKDAERLIDER